MIEGRFTAMGTRVSVVAPDEATVHEVGALFSNVEAVCSRFLPDSELSRLNRSGPGRVALSPLLAEVLGCARDLRERTGGLVDPAVGRALREWGYDRSFEMVTARADRPDPIVTGEWILEGDVVDLGPGTELDLGGIAKGWTCDRAVETTAAAVVNAGGDLRSKDPGLVVDVEDPWGGTAARLSVGSGAVATSTVAHRAWQVGDQWAHHIIDPRTGRPRRGPVVTASVVASTAAEAEAAAKAVLLLGEEGLAWASRQAWVRGALVVWHDGRVFATAGLEVAA